MSKINMDHLKKLSDGISEENAEVTRLWESSGQKSEDMSALSKRLMIVQCRRLQLNYELLRVSNILFPDSEITQLLDNGKSFVTQVANYLSK